MSTDIRMASNSPAPDSSTRFYGELARWWPLISPVDDYEEEAAEFVRVLREAGVAGTLLELGSGGGHNAFHMKPHFALTLSDLSDEMLAVSRALNPECEHVQGDMRTLDLGRSFDAVFVHDAIDYMTTEAELAAAMATAYRHCKPGGVALFVADAYRETFSEDTSCGGSDGPDGRGVRYLEWTFDPDPSDTLTCTQYTFVTRELDGSLSTSSETHVCGLFPQSTWVQLLEAQGFSVSVVTEQTSDEREPRRLLLARRS